MEPEKNYKSFYTKEANTYHSSRYDTLYGRIFRALHQETIGALIDQARPEGRVLEVACGTGYTTAYLADMGLDVVATDLTPAMMQKARETCKNHKVEFIETNALSLPFPENTFDFVISTRFMHLFPKETQLQLLSEISRVTSSGGYVLVDFDNRTSRLFLAIPHLVYNLVRYRRVAPDTHYNNVRSLEELFPRAGLTPQHIFGVAGYHLVAAGIISEKLAIRLGRAHRNGALRLFSEQLVVLARK